MPDTPEAVASAIESAVESAFGSAPPVQPAPRIKEAQPTPEDKLPPEDDNPLLSALEGEPEPEPQAEGEGEGEAQPESLLGTQEPEFVVEVGGKQETVKGAARVKELLQKGLDYSRGTEEVARVRDQLTAQAQAQQLTARFQQEAIGDIAALKAMDEQLVQYGKVDWAKSESISAKNSGTHSRKRVPPSTRS